MSSLQPVLDDCGCCDEPGTQATKIGNPPGLSALAYRIGTQPLFKARMGTAMGTMPGLSGLTTRDDTDPTIALIDAWATVLDVLTFYQERIANEGFLRTSIETQSVYSLAAEIGYAPNPGVAADVFFAFQLESSPGSVPHVVVPSGTKVQSLPDPNANTKPQTFETTQDFEARVEWNVLQPRPTLAQHLGFGETSVVLVGTSTLLKAGDALLFVGFQRHHNPNSQHWDFRVLESVATNAAANTTTVRWTNPLGHVRHGTSQRIHPEHSDLHIYAMRTRAGVFGFNAPDWRLISKDTRLHWGADDGIRMLHQWPHFRIYSPWVRKQKTDTPPPVIDLDAVYSEAADMTYALLTVESYARLYRIKHATQSSRADFGLTAKTTRIELEGPDLRGFGRHVRDTVVHLQGPEVALADVPLTTPVHGRSIILDRVVGTIKPGHTIIVSGKPARAVVAGQANDMADLLPPNLTAQSHGLTLVTDPPSASQIVVRAGESVQMTSDFSKMTSATNPARVHDTYVWTVRNASGDVGKLTGLSWMLKWVPALDSDETIAEVATVTKVELVDATHTRIALSGHGVGGLLEGCYDRASCRIFANVIAGTHGESRQEVLGSGDASKTFQSFTLKQNPLTYTSSSAPGGGTTTLEIAVDGVTWIEVPTLFGRGPHEQVYVVRIAADGSVTVEFGDGITGARLPTGVENVKATYRVGTGRLGNVDAARVKLLMTRPPGVQSVDNPVATGIGADAESIDSARTNAPQHVVTFDRVVSLTDFEDFARGFAGIAKAQADWLWDGDSRLVFVTVAGTDGASIDEHGKTHDNLVASIESYGDPHQRFVVRTYERLTFGVEAVVFIEPRNDQATVLKSVTDAVTHAFSFANRALGQPVFESEVIAAIQGVAGVLAVDISALGADAGKAPATLVATTKTRHGRRHLILTKGNSRVLGGAVPVALPARRARLDPTGKPVPAQMLVINPSQVRVSATS